MDMTGLPDYCQVYGCSGSYCVCQTAKSLTTPKIHYVQTDGINWQPVMVQPAQVDPIVARLDEIAMVLHEIALALRPTITYEAAPGIPDHGEPL